MQISHSKTTRERDWERGCVCVGAVRVMTLTFMTTYENAKSEKKMKVRWRRTRIWMEGSSSSWSQVAIGSTTIPEQQHYHEASKWGLIFRLMVASIQFVYTFFGLFFFMKECALFSWLSGIVLPRVLVRFSGSGAHWGKLGWIRKILLGPPN